MQEHKLRRMPRLFGKVVGPSLKRNATLRYNMHRPPGSEWDGQPKAYITSERYAVSCGLGGGS